MKGSRPRQIATLALALVLLGVAAFRFQKYLKNQRELLTSGNPLLPSAIRVLPGFKVSLLHSTVEGEGSWIAMTFDAQGRVIISSQGREPMVRLTLSYGKVAKIDPILQPVGSAMGLLYAKNSLFLDCEGPKGRGIYRMADNGGTFSEPKLLRPLDMSMYEHGPHAIVLGPDEKLYVICGDHTGIPTDISPASPVRDCAEDQLLPRDEDPHGMSLLLPPWGGFVLRMDLNGNNCEMFAAGMRNTYDVAFNSDGELFGFDSDDEFEIGLSWYRPIRINHLVSGGDYGYRHGTGKFPEYYQDTLPGALNVGIGSPTGVKFAPTNCAFPPAFHDACFMGDWAYGRLFAVHFTPHGATYDAQIETVLQGTPLNITSLAFGPDGALYFITGGRKTLSGLYRLTYDGQIMPMPAKPPEELAAEKGSEEARRLRREAVAFQGKRDPHAVDFLWPLLASEDRWIRSAARVALESQDLILWKDRALRESNANAGLTALLALARCGGKSTQLDLFGALSKFQFPGLTMEQALLKLRVMELSFIRQGRPDSGLASNVIATLDPLYPSASESENHELCELLLYLDAPLAIAKTLALRDKAATQEEQIYYVMRLRNITKGWTLAQRKDYLGWFLKTPGKLAHPPELRRYFTDSGREYSDGDAVGPYLDNFRQESAATLNPSEREALAAFIPEKPKPPPIEAAGGKFVKAWRMEDLAPHLSSLKTGRHVARGRRVLIQAQCLLCHHFDYYGGSFGPDLTAVGSRMTPHDILESIIEPSKVVADQYQNTLFTFQDGDVLSGRVLGEDDKKLFVLSNGVPLTTMTLFKTNIVTRRLSKISPMPEGLVNAMTADEIMDLIACLQAGHRSTLPALNE